MNIRLLCIIFFIFSTVCSYCEETFPISKYLVPIEVNELNTGIDFIDCIYVINLDHRTDRWQHLNNLFERYNLNANRVRAVNGWNFSEEEKIEAASPYGLRMSPGALGCLLSHVSVLKDAYDREFSLIWIMEDDAEGTYYF